MKKKLLVVLAVCQLVQVLVGGKPIKAEDTSAKNQLENYQQIAEDLSIVEIYDSSDLTLETLMNRNGKIIIEKCIGIVTNKDRDGKILNCQNPDYDYINYSRVEDTQVGDIILTYLIYNPDNNFEDDIMERFDYVIDRQEEN